jgi:hypothetical protein
VSQQAYGVGQLTVVNATALHFVWWETVATDPATGLLVPVDPTAGFTDELWIINN